MSFFRRVDVPRWFAIAWRVTILALPWQTRWFLDAQLAGWPWEQGRVSFYLSWIPLLLTIGLGIALLSPAQRRISKKVLWLIAALIGSSLIDRLFFTKNPQLDPRGLLFAGIIIAAMGVVEDVAVSIASGVMEVREANPRLGFKELFRSGMVVGRDHMGALANTLVFAYVGASLSTLLLYSQYGGSWAKFMNFDLVVDEVVRSLAGTIGLVFTVPITALLAAWAARRTTQTGIRKPRMEEEELPTA